MCIFMGGACIIMCVALIQSIQYDKEHGEGSQGEMYSTRLSVGRVQTNSGGKNLLIEVADSYKQLNFGPLFL